MARTTPQLQITVEREQGDSGDLSKVVSAAQTQKQAGLRVAVKKGMEKEYKKIPEEGTA